LSLNATADNGGIYSLMSTGAGAGGGAGNFGIYHSGFGYRLYITSPTGNVGIGHNMLTPNATLQVSGSFVVSVTGQTATPTMAVNTDGSIGFGNVGNSSYQYYFTGGRANQTGHAITGQPLFSATSNGTYYNAALTSNPAVAVSSGVSNSGYVYGVWSNSLRGRADDEGRLALLSGIHIQFGHSNGTATARETTEARGLSIYPYIQNGTIGNLYALLIGNAAVGGTITGNYFGVYQQDVNAKNYFGGRIGVGTGFPLAKLDVVGTISASDAIQVGVSSLACGTQIGGAIRYSSPSLQVCNGSNWTNIGSGGGSSAVSSTGAVQFNANGNFGGDTDNFFWDNANKRLGIGVSNPASVLDISLSSPGYVRLRDTDSDGAMMIGEGTLGAGSFLPMVYGKSIGNSTALYLLSEISSTNDVGTVPSIFLYSRMGANAEIATRPVLGVQNYNRRLMTVAASGNVGIGTATPASTLQVSGSFIVSSTQQADDAPGLFVGTNGKVGIGTVGGSGALEVSGGAVVLEGPYNGTNRIIFKPSGTSGNTWELYPSTDNIGLYDRTNSVYRWRMTNGGNLGIGTINPLAKLDVAGTISATDAIQVGSSSLACGAQIRGALRYNSTSNTMQVCNSVGWVSLSSGTAAGADNLGNHTATQNIQLGSYWLSGDGDDEGLNISAAGDIGVGAPASSNYAFYINKTLVNTAGTTGGIYSVVTASPTADGAGSYYGSVGVLKTAGSRNFNGSLRAAYAGISHEGTGSVSNTYSMMVYNQNAGVGNIVNQYGIYNQGFNTSGGTVQNYYGLYIPAYNGTAPSNYNYAIYAASSAQSNYLAGKTGIGRAIPVATLDVVGSISASTSVDVGTQVFGNSSDSAGAPTYAWSGNTNTGMFTPASNTIGFSTAGTERMRVWGANVGINTTAPSTSLYVNGQIGGGFGAVGTSGVKDWNDISNARSGSGYTLLRGTDATNAPTSDSYYFHPFSYEYGTKDGSGQLTQFAIPYAVAGSLAQGMYVRGRYSGTWTGWYQFPVIDPTGKMGINTNAPKASLDVVGSISATGGVSVTGNVQAQEYLHHSDRRLKDDIKGIPNAAEILSKLRGTHFRWKSNGQFSYGLIAQEVEEVLPELVPAGEGMKSVAYDQMTPILIEGWKIHQKSIEGLQAANDRGRERLDLLEQTNDGLRRWNLSLRDELKAAVAANDNLLRAVDELRREVRALKQVNKK
jgi:hypothetical protein